MSKRFILLRRIAGQKNEEGQRFMELEIKYDIGGVSMLSGSSFTRGYYYSVSTNSQRSGDGVHWNTTVIGRKDDPKSDVSICDLILESKRFSAAKMDALLTGWRESPALAVCVNLAMERTQFVAESDEDKEFLQKLGAFAIYHKRRENKQQQLPVTIQAMLAQMGSGLGGARIYVGAGPVSWKCPEANYECRPRFRSEVQPDGLIKYDVGVEFPVNGTAGQDWRITVTYEADDTYVVRMCRKALPRELSCELKRVLLDTRTDVYCDELKSVIEQMYDRGLASR